MTVDGDTFVPDEARPRGMVYVPERMAYEDIADHVLTGELADYRPPPGVVAMRVVVFWNGHPRGCAGVRYRPES